MAYYLLRLKELGYYAGIHRKMEEVVYLKWKIT